MKAGGYIIPADAIVTESNPPFGFGFPLLPFFETIAESLVAGPETTGRRERPVLVESGEEKSKFLLLSDKTRNQRTPARFTTDGSLCQ